MGQPAARVTDMVKQDDPHCHAPIHPPAPVPTPTPHPAEPMAIVTGSPNVRIGGRNAARVTDRTGPCMMGGCVPSGPGMISKGSTTVRINGKFAARVGDPTTHTACVAPIPAPTGAVQAPGMLTVRIGG